MQFNGEFSLRFLQLSIFFLKKTITWAISRHDGILLGLEERGGSGEFFGLRRREGKEEIATELGRGGGGCMPPSFEPFLRHLNSQQEKEEEEERISLTCE